MSKHRRKHNHTCKTCRYCIGRVVGDETYFTCVNYRSIFQNCVVNPTDTNSFDYAVRNHGYCWRGHRKDLKRIDGHN